MPASTPAEVDRMFAECMNAGDVEGVVALYEPGAVMVAPHGPASCGHDAIRARIRELVASEFEIAVEVVAVHQSGDTAVVYNNWSGARRGPCGERLPAAGKALEVVRRQPDGSWLFLVDDPFGRR